MTYMSIITSYIDWLSKRISSVYLSTLYNSNLKEAYKPLNITQNNIKASILSILYTNKDILNTLSNSELLDLLNDEFLKAKIIFVPSDELKIKATPKYERSGLVYAETDYLIEIYVNNTFYNILRNTEIDSDDQNIINLADDIYSLYSHEATHLNQKEKEKIPQSGIDPNTLTTPSKVTKYLSQIREIAGHARELANQLILSEKSVKEIENLLSTRSGSIYLAKNYKIYQLYWLNFGIALNIPNKDRDKDALWRIKIFNRFKKYIVYFLHLDLRFFYKDDIKYTFD